MAKQQQKCSSCDCLDGTVAPAPERFCPHMSDNGRAFTNFHTRCAVLGQTMSTYDKRMYFINNAEKLINQDRVDLYARLGCSPCYGYNDVGTAVPEQSQVVCDGRTCTIKITNPCGLGTGRKNTDVSDRSFDRGTQEIPFYPIDSFSDGKYALCSRFGYFNSANS